MDKIGDDGTRLELGLCAMRRDWEKARSQSRAFRRATRNLNTHLRVYGAGAARPPLGTVALTEEIGKTLDTVTLVAEGVDAKSFYRLPFDRQDAGITKKRDTATTKFLDYIKCQWPSVSKKASKVLGRPRKDTNTWKHVGSLSDRGSLPWAGNIGSPVVFDHGCLLINCGAPDDPTRRMLVPPGTVVSRWAALGGFGKGVGDLVGVGIVTPQVFPAPPGTGLAHVCAMGMGKKNNDAPEKMKMLLGGPQHIEYFLGPPAVDEDGGYVPVAGEWGDANRFDNVKLNDFVNF